MKLKIIKHKIELVETSGAFLPSAFGRSLECAVADLFGGICHDGNGFVIADPHPEKNQHDRKAQRIFSPGFPVTIMGWLMHNYRHACYSIEIGDRDTAFKLWRLARHGYLSSLVCYYVDKGGAVAHKDDLKQIWHCANLRQNPEERSLGNLAGYSRYYRGQQVSPEVMPSRAKERWLGAEIECFMPKAYSREDLLKAFQNKYIWGICAKGDGSLIPPNNDFLPVELVLCRPRSGYEVPLNRFCSLIESMGGIVNETCGLHVHFDFRGSTKEGVKRRAEVLNAHMPFVSLLLPEHRRNNRYCRPGLSWDDRYRMVNLTAFERYQTLEVRAHQGTIDHQKILNWIRLCEVLMGWPISTLRNKSFHSWLEHLPLSMAEKDYWQERARQFSGEASFKTRLLPEDIGPMVNTATVPLRGAVTPPAFRTPSAYRSVHTPDGIRMLDVEVPMPLEPPASITAHPVGFTTMPFQSDEFEDDEDEDHDDEAIPEPTVPTPPAMIADPLLGFTLPEGYNSAMWHNIPDNIIRLYGQASNNANPQPIPPPPNLGVINMTEPLRPDVF